MNPEKIIHINLFAPFNGQNDYYFGSVNALYQTIPEGIIGAPKSTVYRKLSSPGVFITPKGIINRSEIIRTKRS